MSFEETYSLFTKIFDGEKTPEEIENILLTFAAKGEAFEEIAGAAKAMKEHAIALDIPFETFDVCGTGGSSVAKTFNISTAVAIVLASAEVCVAKHGNRAASSQSGSADVLEALGISIAITPEQMIQNLKEKNLAFLFAQVLHPKMKDLMPIRKKIGTRTIFNLLGPLTSPANPSRQVVGVSEKRFLMPMAKALQLLGRKSAMVVWGEDGLDEATIRGKTYFVQFDELGILKEGNFSAEDFGLRSLPFGEKIEGGTPEENARIIKALFQNTLDEYDGYEKDIFLLNAGIAFQVAQKTHSIHEGIRLAQTQITSGKASSFLQTLV